MEKLLTHQCLPISASVCPNCGEVLSLPTYCDWCGENITPKHACAPRPLPHICGVQPAPARCLNCGEEPPVTRYCPTCGQALHVAHQCATTLPQVRRASPVHSCRALPVQHCPLCGVLKPALAFCDNCGVDITPQHVCAPGVELHVCPPYQVMPRRCPHCGDIMPALQHCARCGKNITPEHVCGEA